MNIKTQKKLNYLQETKDLIKAAIEEKGQTVSDTDTFRSYAAKIQAIQAGGASGVVTVTFCNYDGTELFSRQVFIGDDCPDPVTQGKIETPTKASTVQYSYTHNGWSLTEGGAANSSALKNITEEKTVYASFAENVIYYTVNFYDGDTLKKTEQVAYGSQATPPNTIKDGYVFVEWTPSDLTIYGDTDFIGTWEIDEGWLAYREFPNSMGSNTNAGYSQYSPDGSKLFVACGTTLYMYDATTMPYTLLDSCAFGTSVNAYDIAVSPSGNLVVISQDKYVYNYAAMILLFSVSGKSLNKVSGLPTTSIGSSMQVCGLVFDSTGDTLYALDRKGTYLVEIDTTTLSCNRVAVSVSSSAVASDIDISPDGTTLACAVNSVWNTRNGHLLDITNNYAIDNTNLGSTSAQFGTAQRVAYSPNGKYLAFGCYTSNANSNQYELVVFDTSTSPYTKVLTENTDITVKSVAFSKDSSMLAVGIASSPYIEVYDTGTWKKRDTPRVLPTGIPSTCAFNHNGTMLAIGTSSAEHVNLYEVNK